MNNIPSNDKNRIWSRFVNLFFEKTGNTLSGEQLELYSSFFDRSFKNGTAWQHGNSQILICHRDPFNDIFHIDLDEENPRDALVFLREIYQTHPDLAYVPMGPKLFPYRFIYNTTSLINYNRGSNCRVYLQLANLEYPSE